MFDELKKRLKEVEEGNVPHMYLDSLGYVTVGVGHLLATSAAAATLPFTLESGSPAGVEAIREEWARVKAMAANQLPRYYRERTSLRLPQAAIDELLEADVSAMQRGLCALLPEVAGMPASAQDALLDMAFQVGAHGLVAKFPKLVAAARSGRFAECAAECRVGGIAESRNQMRADLFRRATEA